MAKNDLKRMNRVQLTELLLAERHRISELEDEVAALNAKLEEREIKIENAGSIAEASLSLNGVFESTEAACRQYIENVERLCSDREKSSRIREESSKKESGEIIEKAKRDEIKDKYIEAADKMCKNYCIIPRLFCYNGETSIEGMSRHCDECPLVKGYREICIL